MNYVMLAGRLGKDPETRTSDGGAETCRFSLAVNRRDKVDGEWTTTADWYSVICFSHQASFVGRYGSKGALAIVRGRISQRTWTDKEGVEHHSVEVAADEVELPKLGEAGQGRADNRPSDRGQGDGRHPPQGSRPRPVVEMALDDDIPF